MLNTITKALLVELDTLCRTKLKLKGDIDFVYRDPFGTEFPIREDTDSSVIDQVKQEIVGGSFAISNKGIVIASFSLCAFPGNPNVIVSYNSSVYYKYRNNGLGTLLCKIKEEFVRQAGANTMVCSVNSGNEHQLKIMKTCGWRSVPEPSRDQWGNIIFIKHIKK